MPTYGPRQRQPAFPFLSPPPPLPYGFDCCCCLFQTLLVIGPEVLDEAVHKLPSPPQQRRVISLEAVAGMTPARLLSTKTQPGWRSSEGRRRRLSQPVSAVGSFDIRREKSAPPPKKTRPFTSGEVSQQLLVPQFGKNRRFRSVSGAAAPARGSDGPLCKSSLLNESLVSSASRDRCRCERDSGLQEAELWQTPAFRHFH